MKESIPIAISHETYNASEFLIAEAMANGLKYSRILSYPSEATIEALPRNEGRVLYQRITPNTVSVILKVDDGIVEMELRDGFFHASSYAETEAKAEALLEFASGKVPRSELETDEINVTFWTNSARGPVATARKVTCPSWADVENNYTDKTRNALEQLLATQLDVVQGGKLLLWHGQAGTGKTYALRAWAKAWRNMMDINYIVDPEIFFGKDALYMVTVLLGNSGYDSPNDTDKPRWNLIVAEDTGELLARDAKQTSGQSLSRLLNVCDGLIGQGLRTLVLITTNEELGALHDAVTRPGRCLANINFGSLDGAETERWLRAHGAQDRVQSRGRMTIAQLYSELKESAPIVAREKQKVGF